MTIKEQLEGRKTGPRERWRGLILSNIVVSTSPSRCIRRFLKNLKPFPTDCFLPNGHGDEHVRYLLSKGCS